MELRLSIHKDDNAVEPIKVSWTVEDGPKSFAQLLEDVDCSLDLTQAHNNLSDYTIEFAGLDCPTENSVWALLENGDELCIRPKQVTQPQRQSEPTVNHHDIDVDEGGWVLQDNSNTRFTSEHSLILEPALEEESGSGGAAKHWATKVVSNMKQWWASLESDEALHNVLRNNSRSEVAQNYHHDHLLHLRWPSKDRPSLRRGACVVCPKRREQLAPKLAAIEAFANEGCFYCKLICELITRHGPIPLPTNRSQIEWIGEDWHAFGLDCDKHAENRHTKYGKGTCGFEVFLPPEDDNYFKDLTVANLTTENTGSEAALRKASVWLQSCLEEHERCGSTKDVPLPRRVLDLGVAGAKAPLRLYETMDDETGRYMCLSHCWGAAEYPAKTTSLTIDQNRAGISWNDLPKTFQEAITVTRWFKIRFLWIDSLCIFQDSKEDWQEESVKMVDIYRGSFLTIAATGASSDHDGCFMTTSPGQEARRLSGHSFDGKPYHLYFRTHLKHASFGGHYIEREDEEHDYNRQGFPLISRAWCYQEILLSPRVLHFARDELTWECMEHTTCECAGQTSPLHPSFHGSLPKKQHVLSLESDLGHVEDRWRRIIEEYSSLGLTFGKDKLPALSGLAKQMQRYRRKDTYLAGLWRNSLVEDLLWRVTRTESENTDTSAKKPSWRSPTWRAPTWSWASVDCRIEYPYLGEVPIQSYCQVIDASCVPADKDPTGEILLAEVVLNGKLIPATWRERIIPRETTRALYLKLADSEIISWHNRLDDFRYPVPRAGEPYYGRPLDIETDYSGYTDFHDHPTTMMPDIQFFCLPILGYLPEDVGGVVDMYLILTPALPETTHYQRFGLAIVGPREPDEPFPFLDFPDRVFTIV